MALSGEVALRVAGGASARDEGGPAAMAVERAADGYVERAWVAAAVAEEAPDEIGERHAFLACDQG